MQAERVTRALIALILLCLLILVFRGFFGDDEQAPSREGAVTPQPLAQPAPDVTAKPAPGSGAASPASPTSPVMPLQDSEVQLFIDTLLGDELPAEVRAWTARQLAATEGPRVTQALLDALDDPSPEVVSAAAEALEGRDDPRVGPALEKLAGGQRQESPPSAPEGLRIETLD